MKYTTFQVGAFEVNCTVLSEGDKAWIVDPGGEAERIVDLLRQRKLVPVAILLTHAHFDHIGGIPWLRRIYPHLPVYVGAADEKMIGHPLNQFPPDYPHVGKIDGLASFEELNLPGMEVIETPGHTPGGVCYFFKGRQGPSDRPLLLSGDTLFAGSVGRTDLPGGDMATLMDSLRKLVSLPDDTVVIPGHGPCTSIAAERVGNPFLER